MQFIKNIAMTAMFSVITLGLSSQVQAARSGRSLIKPAKDFHKLGFKTQNKLTAGGVTVSAYKVKNKAGKGIAVAVARIVINASPAKAFKILTDFRSRPKYMPNLKKVKVISKKGNKYYVYQLLKVMWVKIPIYLKITTIPGKKIGWKLDKSKKNGVKENIGAWEFQGIKFGKKTLLTYSVYTDTGRYVPGFVERMLIKRSIPTLLKNIKKRVESNGKWKK